MRVRRGRWPMIGMALTVMLVTIDASGQALILPETRALQLGPMALYPTIALRDVGVDSNVYNDEIAPRSDLTSALTSKIFAVVPIGNTRFVATGIGDLVYFQTYPDQRSVTAQVEGRYEVTSPGFRPFASAGFVSRGGREGYEIDARIRRTQSNLMMGADMDVTPITAITAWASRSTTLFTEDDYLSVALAEQLDHDREAAAAGARFRLTPLTTLLVAAEIQRDRFEQLTLRDVDSFRLAPGLAIDTGGTMSGDVNAGYRVFSPRDASLKGYRGFVGSARLHYTLLNVTRFDVEANRDVDFSFDPDQPYYLESGGRLVVTQRVLGPLDVIGIGERRDLRNQPRGSLAFDGRHEVTTSIGGGVGVQLQKQMRLALTYERTERNSSEPVGRNYERTRVLGSLSYGISL